MVKHASFIPQVQAIWSYADYMLNMEQTPNWSIRIDRRLQTMQGGMGIKELWIICKIARFK
jgi:hypothetical protein